MKATRRKPNERITRRKPKANVNKRSSGPAGEVRSRLRGRPEGSTSALLRRPAGPGSADAVEAVRQIAAKADSPALRSPILIHGPKAARKSAVLTALASRLREKDVRFVRLDGAKAKRGLRASEKAVATLAAGQRSARVVIVHNFATLLSSIASEPVCSMLVEMAGRGHHVVVASDKPPERLRWLPEAFRRALHQEGLSLRMEVETKPKARIRLTPEEAATLSTIADFFGIRVSVLIGKSRKPAAAHARHVGMYVLYTDRRDRLSLPGIGRLFGNRDHTTVLYAVEKIGAMAAVDPPVAREVAALRRRLGIKGLAPRAGTIYRGAAGNAKTGAARRAKKGRNARR